jgi:hypothetical protein
MLSKSFLSILFFGVTLVFCQAPALTLSNYDTPSYGIGWNMNRIVGSDETGTYFFDDRNLVKLNKEGKVILRKEIPWPAYSPKTSWETYVLRGGRLWMLNRSDYDKSTGSRKVYAQEIDKSTFDFSGSPKVIDEAKGESKLRTPFQYILHTPSDKYITIVVPGENSYFKIFDANMDVLRDKTPFKYPVYPQMDYSESNRFNSNFSREWPGIITMGGVNVTSSYLISSFHCDEIGNVFMNVYRIRNSGGLMGMRPSKEKPGPNDLQSNSVLIYRKNAAEPMVLELDKEGAPSITTMTINKAGELVCGGFYMVEGAIRPAGIKYVTIDPVSAKVILNKEIALDYKVMEGLPTEPEDKVKSPFSPLPEKHFYEILPLVTEDFSKICFAFEHIAVHEADNAKSNEVPAHYPDCREIVSVCVSKEGELLWQKKLPRWLRTESHQRGPKSFLHTVSKGNYYAFYTDHPENVSKQNIKEMSFIFPEKDQLSLIQPEKKWGAIVYVIIDGNGSA